MNLRMTMHISFFYQEDRIHYLDRIIDEAKTYHYPTDIFIHTNKRDLTPGDFHDYPHGLKIVWHDLGDTHPYYLTWKCRDLLRQQKDEYDVFLYVEDDILIPEKAIQYWMSYHEILITAGYNLGFLRIEIKDGEEYLTDLIKPLQAIVSLNGDSYVKNEEYPYCAFWIYDKIGFRRFLDSPYYDINTIRGYGVRESSAIGLHGTPFYKGTLIPIVDGYLHKDCRIYHMPNNYVSDNSTPHAKINFRYALR